MAIKAFTDLEQSKKLTEILPIKTADFMWEYDPHKETYLDMPTMIPINLTDSYIFINDVPCWSLASLLDILPETIEDEWAEYDLQIDMIDKKPKYVRLGDCYHSDFPSWDWDNEELLDNIVEAIIWLNNNDYLQK